MSRARFLLPWAVAAVGFLASCKDEITKGPEPSAADPIVFGVTLGLTGESAGASQEILFGVRVAESQINALGGIDGRPVRFKEIDDRGEAGQPFLDQIESLISTDGVQGIIGPVTSSQMAAAYDIIQSRVPMVSPSATSVGLGALGSASDRWAFRTLPSDAYQVEAMALFARQGIDGMGGNCQKMAIVHNDDLAYGQSFRDGLQAAFERRGGTVVASVPVPVDVKAGYDAELAEVFAGAPECVALVVYEKTGGALVKALQERRGQTGVPEFFLVGADGLYNDGFLEASRTQPSNPNTAAAEGCYGTVADANPQTRSYLEFRGLAQAYRPALLELRSYTAAAYDAALLLVLARQKAGLDDGMAVRDALREVSSPPGKLATPATLAAALQDLKSGSDIDYAGASGPVDFLDDGSVLSAFAVWRVNQARFTTLGSFTPEELR